MSDITDRTFDCLPSLDPQNADHPIRAVIGDHIKRRPRMWRSSYTRLDQGREGACVGFGWTGELLGWPVPCKIADPDRFARESVYRPAQHVDEFASTPPGSGTSVNAGAKICRQLGYIGSWRWCDGIDDVIDALIVEGPVVVGVNWHETMGRPRPSGLLEVSGAVRGGHCVVLTGYTRATLHADKGYGVLDLIRFRNSWGADWGLNGNAWFRAEDLGRLLEAGGDACVPQDRRTV